VEAGLVVTGQSLGEATAFHQGNQDIGEERFAINGEASWD
jgi:hypothetical protein